MLRKLNLWALILPLTVAGCGPRQENVEPAPADAPAATAPQPPAAAGEPPAAPAESTAGARISSSIRFSGFGPAPFGATEEAVRQAWGRGLFEGPQAAGSACRYLYFSPEGETDPPYPLAFMIEDGKFARLDVHSADYAAPGGGRVGMTTEQIRTRYRDRLDEQPHKYGDGKYLIASPKRAGPGRLVFETDGAGTVTEWRVGLPPQVHWVEGCA